MDGWMDYSVCMIGKWMMDGWKKVWMMQGKQIEKNDRQMEERERDKWTNQ